MHFRNFFQSFVLNQGGLPRITAEVPRITELHEADQKIVDHLLIRIAELEFVYHPLVDQLSHFAGQTEILFLDLSRQRFIAEGIPVVHF
jgi:hypothetical protein